MSQAGILTGGSSGGTPIETVTGNSGGAVSPDGAGNINIVGTGSITVAGSTNTETIQLTGLTNHNVLVGAGTATVTKVAPSSTSGVPLVSQGAAADPAFGTAVVAGGGTGQVTLTNHGVLVGAGTAAVTQLATGTAGQVLQSGGAAADPLYSTATYPSTAGTSGNVITSNGTNFVSQALPAFPTTNLTNHSVALGTGTANLSSVGPSATSGSILQSAGSSSDPAFSTAAYPTTAGTSGNIITSNGTNFVSSAPATFSQIVTQVFTSSGTYTPTTGMKYCIVEIVGGGGGGGGASATTAIQAAAGGGGAGGLYARKSFSAATVGASQTVTIGAGGTAGSNAPGNGAQGGFSLFGVIFGPNGGNGGLLCNATGTCTTVRGGLASAASSGGDITAGGSPGGSSLALFTTTGLAKSGVGGSSCLGAGGSGIATVGTASAGNAGLAYGGGGSGGASTNGIAVGGGAGAAGVVIVTEYI